MTPGVFLITVCPLYQLQIIFFVLRNVLTQITHSQWVEWLLLQICCVCHEQDLIISEIPQPEDRSTEWKPKSNWIIITMLNPNLEPSMLISKSWPQPPTPQSVNCRNGCGCSWKNFTKMLSQLFYCIMCAVVMRRTRVISALSYCER